MKWLPYGPNAWLLRFADGVGDEAFFRARRMIAELERNPPAGLIEFVPGLTTILFEFAPHWAKTAEEGLPHLLERLTAGTLTKVSRAPVKEVPVRYDGPDLERIAQLHNLTRGEVVERHAAPLYRVYLLGFSPGFPYLGDLDERLHTPRLSTPRPMVRAGSVAIGGQHTGIYTVDSPGGWSIIGHTSLRIFDPQRAGADGEKEEMFWLRPGDRVKFVPMVNS